MPYFPLYMDMKYVKILLVGGGHIATEKLEKLLHFTNEITIIALHVNEDILKHIDDNLLTLHQRFYRAGDIEGYDIVIVATDTIDLQQAIYEESRDFKILVNSVDNVEYCDFIFPSFIQRGDLSIAISTGGASPAFSKKIREYFEDKIPDTVDIFLQEMKNLRSSTPKGQARMKYFETLVQTYFTKYFK